MTTSDIREYRAWDLPIRLFHWINFLCVICLIFIGLVMLFKTELGISGNEARVALKTLHVSIGYVFVLNLLGRIIWGFVGNAYARWRAIIPGRGYAAQLRAYLASLAAGQPQAFVGHNPLGRLAVTLMLLLLIIMAVTGLVRAGTDIYYPPFGALVARYVAQPGTDPADLVPYESAGMDEAKAERLKAFKGPFGEVHLYTAFFLMFVIVVHVFAVVLMEVREGGGLVSAMFTGKKLLGGKPVDAGPD